MIKALYTFLAYPLLHFSFWLLSFFNKKIRQGFEIRKKRAWIKPVEPSTWVWFHVSSGELEYAKPVLRELKRLAKVKTVVTFFSPSAIKNLAQTPEIDLFVPMPWDTPWHWQGFIRNYQPKVLAIARTDIWPNMIWTASRFKIPSILFSATLPSESGRVASRFGRLLYSQIVSCLTRISCVSDDDEANFSRMTHNLSISTDGDTRFDQVIFRISENRPIMLTIRPQRLVIGSSWPEDEKILLPSFPDVVSKGFQIILAPHEPTPNHIAQLEDSLKHLKLSTCRYSLLDENSQVILIDRVGILADLYKTAEIAFVGGSFKKSIHSVMEPAASGCLTFFGPYYTNNREAIALKKSGLAVEVNTTDDIRSLLLNEIHLQQAEIDERKRQIRGFVKNHSGVSPKIANWIKERI